MKEWKEKNTINPTNGKNRKNTKGPHRNPDDLDTINRNDAIDHLQPPLKR